MLLTILKIGFYLCFLGITYLALTPVTHAFIPHWSDKLNHILAFFVLAFWADFCHQQKPIIIATLLLTYGIAIEAIQYFVPGRFMSLADIVADAAPLLVYLAVTRWVKPYPKFKAATLGLFGHKTQLR